jgi:hypothetical protein
MDMDVVDAAGAVVFSFSAVAGCFATAVAMVFFLFSLVSVSVHDHHRSGLVGWLTSRLW